MKEKTKEKNLVPILIVIIILLIGLILVLFFKDKNDNFNNRLKEAGYITTEEALAKTLDDVTLKRSDIKDLDIELTYKYNKDVYEINFNYQNYEYEYYIDAKNGEIIRSFKEKDNDIIIDNNENKEENNPSTPSDNTNPSKNYISRDKALSIAVSHAQVNQNNIYDIDIELDYKYNQEVYEIDFNYQGYEYQYYIDPIKGNILHSFKERD